MWAGLEARAPLDAREVAHGQQLAALGVAKRARDQALQAASVGGVEQDASRVGLAVAGVLESPDSRADVARLKQEPDRALVDAVERAGGGAHAQVEAHRPAIEVALD